MKDKIAALLKPQASTDAKLSVISLFIAKMMEVYERRIENLEDRQLQKGDKGDKGDRGEPGRDGKDGRDGRDGIDGIGRDGKDGKPGAKGKDGVGVVDAEIAADDHLVLKLSSGEIIDAGELPKADAAMGSVHVSGNAWQITVSATQPSSPQLNDLWLDIA